MTFEKPEVRVDVEFGHDLTLAVFAAFIRDARNTVQHEHVGFWQPAIGRAKYLAVSTGDQVVVVVGIFACRQFAR